MQSIGVKRSKGMSDKKDEKKPVYECPYMRVVRCYRQNTKKALDTSICIACVLGRIEKHMFTMVSDKPTRRSSATKREIKK